MEIARPEAEARGAQQAAQRIYPPHSQTAPQTNLDALCNQGCRPISERLPAKQAGRGVGPVSYRSDDEANRRTSLTLPNGISQNYLYDNASQLIEIQYKQAGTLLGNLTYSYDAAGRRIAMGGSYARTDLPAALNSASYDANNRLLSWDSLSFSYDNNGNLLSDGSNSYSWNSRNQLASISGSNSASFSYDASGRRLSKTVNGSNTGYVYDGSNFVQELNGSNVQANLLTGLGTDEVFLRNDGSNSRSLLTNALGSVIALADANGSLASQYSYDPYGKTTASGAADSNSQQYTGRENDGTGLYYYRNRYYSPTTGRFISEDPIGLAGGDNGYAYVGGNPVSLSDPSGLFAFALPAVCAGGGCATLVTAAGTVMTAIVGPSLINGIFSKPPNDARDPNGAKAPGKPGPEEGFKDPKGGENWVPNPNPGKGGASHGWEDNRGRVWCPTGQGSGAHGDPHWDVQKPGGGYDNIYPGGHVRPGR